MWERYSYAMPLLQVENLFVAFRTFEGCQSVVDGVNLSIDAGEKVGLAGETGCGKSVTLKTALGILPIPPGEVREGKVLFQGTDLLKMTGDELRDVRRKYISMIPQDPTAALNPVFKVRNQLLDTVKYSGVSGNTSTKKERVRRVVAILKEVKLPDPERNMNYYPFQLSGGMQQRLLIAMALLTDAVLIFADEPTTALDVTVQHQILRLIDETVSRRGLAIFLITHNLGNVRSLTDRMYVMYAGQVVETAPTRGLFDRPMHPYTKGLISSVPKLTGEGIASGIEGMIPDYRHPPEGCRFHPRCGHAMPICSRKPPRFNQGGGHEVACFLFRKIPKSKAVDGGD